MAVQPGQQTAFYITGGTLPADAQSYVERAADRDLLTSLLSGEYCYVLNSRQMGKSSLSVRTIARLREDGVRTAFVDLTRIGAQNVTAEQWYAGLLAETGRALDLRAEFLSHWRDHLHLPPVQRYFGALREVALAAFDSPLVIFVDEIDAVRSLSFSADEFFAAVRACYNARTEDSVFSGLTFCLVGSATPADLISDTRMSPFNIGRRIELRDFTAAEAAPLATGLGENGQALLQRAMYWTNGHPYLTQRLCRALAENPQSVDALCRELFLTHTAQESDDNLSFVRNRLLRSETDLASLLDLYKRMHSRAGVPDDETNPLTSVLKLSGVARADAGRLFVRNRIYDRVFDREWVTSHMPGAELRRQRAAYRRGLVRAGALAAVVVTVLAASLKRARDETFRANNNAVAATRESNRAKQEAFKANRNLYFAYMGGMQQAWDIGNVGKIESILEETRDNPDRGWEWGYWNRLCHRERRRFEGRFARYIPATGEIWTAGPGNTLRIFDDKTGRERLRFSNGQGIFGISVGRDGPRIATGSPDGSMIIWNARTGTRIRLLGRSRGVISSTQFSPDGKLIATGGGQYTHFGEAYVWDAMTGRKLQTLKGHRDIVWQVDFSKDGRKLITSSEDGTAIVWDARSGRRERTLAGHAAGVGDAAWFRDGRRVVTCSSDNTAKVWDLTTGRVLYTLSGHTLWLHSVAISPDETHIATGGEDQTVRVWEARPGAKPLVIKGLGAVVQSLSYSPDGRRLLVGNKEWVIADASEVFTIKSKSARYRAFFSPDDSRIISGDRDTARVWDSRTGRLLLTLPKQAGDCYWGNFSPDGRTIATANTDGAVRFWNAETGLLKTTFPAWSRQLWGLAVYSPDGTRLAWPNAAGTIAIRNLSSGIIVSTLRCGNSEIRSIAFSPNGNRIAAGGEDMTVRIWDVETGRELLSLKQGAEVYQVDISHDGERLACACSDGTVRIWSLANGREVGALKGHSNTVYSATFSPDDSRILTASLDNSAKVWNTETNREMLTLRAPALLWYAAFSTDGNRIVTCSNDGALRVYSSDSHAGENQARPR